MRQLAAEGVVVHGSRYAAQLRRGFPYLKFAPDLEKEFRAEHAEQHLPRMRLGFLVAIALYVIFQALRLPAEAGALAMWSLVVRGVVIGAMGLCWVASFTPLKRHLTWFVLASYAAFGGGITAIEILSNYYGVGRHYEALILATFHCFVFGGLLLRPALVGGALILAIYVAGGILGGLAGKPWAYQLVFLGLSNLIGGAALALLESGERDNFLRKKLLAEMAGHDGLTGVYNRSAFLEHFDRVLKQAARERRVIGLLMMDLDFFKQFNDRYGHLEGDEALRGAAQALRNEFRRPLDMLARYGGEEFIGLWYDVAPAQLNGMAGEVRDAVLSLRIPHVDSPHQYMSISVGAIAFLPRGDESLLALIKQADAALYQAKARGRNDFVTEILPGAVKEPRLSLTA